MAKRKIAFNKLKKELRANGVKFTSTKNWELNLPFEPGQEMIGNLIAVCRKHNLVNWHIIFSEPTEKRKKPKTKVYWK